jgi:hypothetical protein
MDFVSWFTSMRGVCFVMVEDTARLTAETGAGLQWMVLQVRKK